MTRIDVFTTGGTISSTPNGDAGSTPSLTGAGIFEGVDTSGVRIEFIERTPVPSSWLTIADTLELARSVDASADDGADAVLVVQGTDTLEETGFVLELARRHDIPVALTGAMRTPAALGADGTANIAAALSYLQVAERGTTAVVLNDEVHPARHVRKAHTTLPNAFASDPFGPLGLVVEQQFVPCRPPMPLLRSELPGLRTTPAPVLLATAALGDDLSWVEPILGRFDGLVYDAFGAGHSTEPAAAVLQMAAAQMPVIITSRTQGVVMPTHTYNYRGSESFFRESGALLTSGLDAYRARLLLSLSVGGGLQESKERYRQIEQLLSPSPAPHSRKR